MCVSMRERERARRERESMCVSMRERERARRERVREKVR